MPTYRTETCDIWMAGDYTSIHHEKVLLRLTEDSPTSLGWRECGRCDAALQQVSRQGNSAALSVVSDENVELQDILIQCIQFTS